LEKTLGKCLCVFLLKLFVTFIVPWYGKRIQNGIPIKLILGIFAGQNQKKMRYFAPDDLYFPIHEDPAKSRHTRSTSASSGGQVTARFLAKKQHSAGNPLGQTQSKNLPDAFPGRKETNGPDTLSWRSRKNCYSMASRHKVL
jgi:hypothetical protein